MTALTTICGMIPLTFGSSEGMGINFQGFGLVLIGGMTSATLFTILAIPVFYTLIEDGRNALTQVLAGVWARTAEPAPVADTPPTAPTQPAGRPSHPGSLWPELPGPRHAS